ncbi:MAG: hypothetical protein ACKVOR_04805 [Flavobacteriales bacterium]
MSLAKREKCLADLKRCFDFLKEDKKFTSLLAGPEVARGDSFQFAISNAAMSLRVPLILQTFFTFDIVVAVGIGKEGIIRKPLGESDGEAFYISGRTLDKMKHAGMSIIVKSRSQSFNDEMETNCMMLEAITSRWTTTQRDVMFYKLLNYTEREIAEVLQISQPAVNTHSKASNWKAIERLLKRFERIASTLK